MGRGHRLWAERDKSTGVVTSCGSMPLLADLREVGREDWNRWAQSSEEGGSWGPWGLLLRLVNVERSYPRPRNHNLTVDRELVEWWKRNRDELPGVGRESWTAFARDVAAPYLLTTEQGHPLLWYLGPDEEWYGFLFNFGLIAGQMHWWVPGTERVEFGPAGSDRVIVAERHEEQPAGATLREVFTALPAGLMEVDSRDRLTLEEALDEVLQQHRAEERDRCRLLIVHPARWEGPAGLATLERERSGVDEMAWTWLSPYVPWWAPRLRAEWGKELADDPNCKHPETAVRLSQMPPHERFARTVALYGGDPLALILRHLQPEAGIQIFGEPRLVPSLVRKTQPRTDVPEMDSEPPWVAAEASIQESLARRQLARSSGIREDHLTTNVFAAAAKQLQWAVSAGLKLLRCPHERCGAAFLVRRGERAKHCPKHRAPAARQERSRQRRKE